MSLVDLVIAPESAVAHLAGSLGVRAWVPLATVTDWRWLLDRDDSPWYPDHDPIPPGLRRTIGSPSSDGWPTASPPSWPAEASRTLPAASRSSSPWKTAHRTAARGRSSRAAGDRPARGHRETFRACCCDYATRDPPSPTSRALSGSRTTFHVRDGRHSRKIQLFVLVGLLTVLREGEPPGEPGPPSGSAGASPSRSPAEAPGRASLPASRSPHPARQEPRPPDRQSPCLWLPIT